MRVFIVSLLSLLLLNNVVAHTEILMEGGQTLPIVSEDPQSKDSVAMVSKGYPVTGFFNDTLFLVSNKSGSFSAQERAQAISKRIKNLAVKSLQGRDTLHLIETDEAIEIVSGETILMSVSDKDAATNNTNRLALAKNYSLIILDAIKEYKSETNIITLLKEIGLAILVLGIFGFVIFYTNRLFRWISVKIHQQHNKLIRGIKIKNYVLLDAHRQVKVLVWLNKVMKWLLMALIIYIALPILFGIFPWTENLAEVLFGYILDPIKNIASNLWNYLPNLITILVIVVVFNYALKGLKYLKSEIENGHLTLNGFYADWANPTYQIARVLIIAFMVIVIFPYLPGSESPVFRGVSVFLGFLFTFGSAGSLSNIIAGLVLTYMRLFKIGDRVKIGEVTGDVIEKSLLVTRIRTIKNEIISIPNSTVMSSHTINYSSDAPDKGLIVHTTVTIGYDVPWRDIHQALIDAALRTDFINHEPSPFVLQTSLDDFYVGYQINAYTKEASQQAAIYSHLHQNIQDVCNERGIEILSPHYRAARDGNMTTIPANYLPKDYQVPSFNVNLKKE